MTYQVRITGSPENPGIAVSGEEQHRIEPKDYALFDLDIERMKSHFENGWGIGRPKNIYLRSDQLPWGDQSYARYGLEDVTMHRRAVSARILDVVTEPFAALGLPARNTSSHKASVHLDTNLSITNSVGTSWNAEASVGQSVEVGVEVGGEAVGAKASVKSTTSVTASYGQGGSSSKDVQVGAAGGVQVELEPHSGAQAKLTASRGRIVALVEYETWISGHIWIDFGRRVKRRPQDAAHAFFFERADTSVPKPRLRDRLNIDIDLYANYGIDIEDLALDGPSAEG